MAMVCPSCQPSSRSRARKDERCHSASEGGEPRVRIPSRGILTGCCAVATSGVQRRPMPKVTRSPMVLSRMVEFSQIPVCAHRGCAQVCIPRRPRILLRRSPGNRHENITRSTLCRLTPCVLVLTGMSAPVLCLYQKREGYCWSSFFHTMRLLLLWWILKIFGPSTTACARHHVR